MRGRAIGLLNEFLKPKAKLTRPLINPAIPCKDILNFHFSFHSVKQLKEFIFKKCPSFRAVTIFMSARQLFCRYYREDICRGRPNCTVIPSSFYWRD
jgi:hypothetical protein